MNEITTSNNSIDTNINTIPEVTKRKKIPAKNKKDKLPLIAIINNGSKYINLDSELKWTQNLTDAQRLFVFHYANQSNLKKNAAEAARLAGYSEKTAKTQAGQLLKNPLILAEIKNINTQLLKNFTKLDLESTVKAIIERKQARLNMRAEEFYNIERKTTDDGFEYVNAMIKTPEELTDEQKELIEDVEFVGQRSIPHYKIPSKTQTENELLKIYKDLKDTEENGNDFDIETTAEIIGEKLQVKTKVIKQNRETAEMSELAAIGAITREEED